jgi:hypothetical protein
MLPRDTRAAKEKADAFVGRHRPYVTGRTPLETAYPAFS